jgi:medium-chain acyl-[acyl-carrier-protein] hydrolase
MKYSGNYTIRTNEITKDKTLSVPSMLMLMQEASMQNVIELKASVWDMEKDDMSWVLLRKKLNIFRYPVLGDVVTVVTYPSHFEKVFAFRDYKMYDVNGELLAQASSTWTLLNTKTRKLEKIPQIFLDMKTPNDEEILTPPESKIIRPEKCEFSKKFKIGWFDIDWNEHVNSVFLIKSIIESTPKEILKTRKIIELIYHIRSESFFGETVRVEGESVKNSYHAYRMHNVDREKEVVFCIIMWRLL